MSGIIASIRVFCIAAIEDTNLQVALDKHLAPLKNTGKIVTFSNLDLPAGIDWKETLNQHINQADIILLLISPDFIVAYHNVILPQVLNKADTKTAIVIPIIVRAVDWHNTPVNKFKVLPFNEVPIKSWNDPDEAFLDVVRGIDNVSQTFLAKRQKDIEAPFSKTIYPIINSPESYRTSLASIEKAIESDYSSIQRYIDKSKILIKLKRYQEAVTIFDALLILDQDRQSNNTNFYEGRGDALLGLKRYDEALEAYRRAARLSPHSSYYPCKIGNVFLEDQHYKEALEIFGSIFGSGNPEVHKGRGDALFGLKRYSEALIAFDEAIYFLPDFTAAYKSKGDALEALDRHEEALAAYELARRSEQRQSVISAIHPSVINNSQ